MLLHVLSPTRHDDAEVGPAITTEGVHEARIHRPLSKGHFVEGVKHDEELVVHSQVFLGCSVCLQPQTLKYVLLNSANLKNSFAYGWQARSAHSRSQTPLSASRGADTRELI